MSPIGNSDSVSGATTTGAGSTTGSTGGGGGGGGSGSTMDSPNKFSGYTSFTKSSGGGGCVGGKYVTVGTSPNSFNVTNGPVDSPTPPSGANGSATSVCCVSAIGNSDSVS